MYDGKCIIINQDPSLNSNNNRNKVYMTNNKQTITHRIIASIFSNNNFTHKNNKPHKQFIQKITKADIISYIIRMKIPTNKIDRYIDTAY